MKILLSTSEGYMKNNTLESKRKLKSKMIAFTFSGPDAPVKAARALIQKYGITPEELKEDSGT